MPEQNNDPNVNQNSDEQGQSNSDPLLNLKSEISRKLQNSDSQMSQLMKQNQQLAESLKAISSRLAPAPKAANDDDELESLAYSDPKRYAQKISDMATSRATEAVSRMNDMQAQKTQVLSSLYKDYPELASTDSELTKTAVEIYNNLSPEDQRSPSSYKLAVREAAATLGVLPSSKRSSQSEDFVAPGSRGSNSMNSRQNSKSKNDEIDPNVLETAKLFGRDVKDPKVLERLKQASKRSKWNRYE